jgi:hypothetical protein
LLAGRKPPSAPPLFDKTQLARIAGLHQRLGTLQIVMRGVELPDELVEPEGSLPDFQQQGASGTATADAGLPIDGGIVGFVPPATASELARSNLQTIYTSTEPSSDSHPLFFLPLLESRLGQPRKVGDQFPFKVKRIS